MTQNLRTNALRLFVCGPGEHAALVDELAGGRDCRLLKVPDVARHLLFVALAGHGHVTPTLPLVEELVRRGHQVDYATAAEFAESVTGAGAHWVALPALEPFSPPAQVGPDLVAVWFRHYFAAMRATCPVLREYCRTAPDRSPTPTG